MVIGNHYPEFNFERDINAVKESLVRLNVPYPVLQDNGRETWNAYNNRYWPALYLIDKQGRIRYRHFGEAATSRPNRPSRTCCVKLMTRSQPRRAAAPRPRGNRHPQRAQRPGPDA